MKVISFLFEPTNQWLNYGIKNDSSNIGLYRGLKSDESNWSIHEVSDHKYILRHIKTGITFDNFTYYPDGDDGNNGNYKISITDPNNKQNLNYVLDTDAYDNPHSNTIIFWRISNNPVNTNQKWKIVVHANPIQIYNQTANAYLVIQNNKFVVSNHANVDVEWSINNNIFRHYTSRLQNKSLKIQFVTPLDVLLVSSSPSSSSPSTNSVRYLIVTRDNTVGYTSDIGHSQLWRFLDPDVVTSTSLSLPLSVPSTKQTELSLPKTIHPPINQIPTTYYESSKQHLPVGEYGSKPTKSTKYTKDTLSILTLNVQAYESVEGNTDVVAAKILEVDKQLGHDIDVICIQEDLIHHTMVIPQFTRVAVCAAESWTYDNYDDNLANSIWVRDDILDHTTRLKSTEVTSGCKVPRCVSGITTIVNHNNITIANTHLCGGRYDDPHFNDLIDTKEREITDIINTYNKPTIIVGDFNAGYQKSSVEASLSKYPLYSNLSPHEKVNFLRFYSSMHDTIRDHGYTPAYDERTIAKTSVYGGLPDWIYYIPNQLSVVDVQLANFITPVQLTDHNGVYVKFLIGS